MGMPRCGIRSFQVLPKTPTGIVWKAGDEVEAVWSVLANHGGGYQYRLCPSEDTLTEACFREIAVEFAGKTSLLWGDGSRMAINGKRSPYPKKPHHKNHMPPCCLIYTAC